MKIYSPFPPKKFKPMAVNPVNGRATKCNCSYPENCGYCEWCDHCVRGYLPLK